MGLLDFLKSNKSETIVSKTGIYSVSGKNLTPLNELPKTGSYNDIAESLGFQTYHSVMSFDSQRIEYIAFKSRTKEPLFVQAKDKSQALSYSDITRIIQEIDWGFEWRHLDWVDNIK